MAKVKLKGVTPIHRKLADGAPVTYWYAWRGGPLIKDKKGRPAQPHQPEFVRQYTRLTEGRDAIGGDTLATLIAEFKNSPDFKNKSKDTRREYEGYLDKLPEKFKKMKICDLENKRARGHFKEWRDSMSDTARAADYAYGTVQRVLSHAFDRGRITTNVLTNPKKLSTPDRTEKIWTDKHIEKIEKFAPEHVMIPIWVALNTAQRRGDVLSLVWSQYDGEYLKIKQGKKKAYVQIPVFGFLKQKLDGLERTSTHICTNSRGRPWTKDGFNSSLDKARRKAELMDVTFHDLRGTAVVHLARAGCSIPEIASYTGHSLDDVNEILDAHYLGARAELAKSAGEKLKDFQLKKSKG